MGVILIFNCGRYAKTMFILCLNTSDLESSFGLNVLNDASVGNVLFMKKIVL